MNAPRRISGPLAALGSAAMMVGLFVQPTPVGAASPQDLTLSAFGTARIDGVRGGSEWDRAARIDFEAVLPASDSGARVPAAIYVMNDSMNLYLAASLAAIPGCTYNPVFEFDNDNDGDRSEIGNDWVAAHLHYSVNGNVELLDQFVYPVGNVGLDTFTRSDYPPAGTIDGAAAGSHPGGTTTWVEMSHPLDGADDLHDFSLGLADLIGFRFFAHTSGTGCGNCTNLACHGNATVPAEGFAHIRIASPPARAPVPSRSWWAAISGAGVSGRASVTVPATGRATTAFSLYRLKTGVSVSARIVAGAACDATATTITRLPGYTTSSGGTWRQRWVFDGAGLVRLRSAARSGTPLWFHVSAGGIRMCARLIEVAAPGAAAATSGTRYITSDTTLAADHYGNIVIAADNVTLDGAGHTLHASREHFSCHGVQLTGHTGVTIRGLTVQGFTCGAGFLVGYDAAVSTTGNALVDCAAEGNYAGFVLDHATRNTLIRNRSDDNVDNGFQIQLGSHNNTFTGNAADGNRGTAGFAMADSNGNSFVGNVATASVRVGFHSVRSSGSIYRLNRATDNGGDGFVLYRSDEAMLDRNTADRNSRGFEIEDSDANTFTANRACTNRIVDVHQDASSTGNTYSRNTFCTTEGL